jgi:signal transduction histidine kinase
MTLGMIQHELRSGPAPARVLAAKASDEAHAAMVELRELVRGIHPQVLTDHGLTAAVSELADRSPLPVTVTFDAQRLPSIVESTAYYVIAEAITNAVKHAKAKTIAVNGWMTRGPSLIAEIRDDGLGGADPSHGTGLAGLADRVAAIGGVFTFSSPLGGPTIVHLELPCFASS